MRRLAVLAATVLLAACGSGVQSGRVIAKTYDDPDTYYVLVGKVLVPQVDPAHWYLTLDGLGNDGAEHREDCEVDETTYHEVNVGQQFDCEKQAVTR